MNPGDTGHDEIRAALVLLRRILDEIDRAQADNDHPRVAELLEQAEAAIRDSRPPPEHPSQVA